MIFLGMFILIPLLFPFVVGLLLGFGIRKTRSDLLALFVSIALLLLQGIVMKRFGINNEASLHLFPQTVPTTTILILCVLSSISIRLIFPYIFARWGVDLGDRIRAKSSPSIRSSSKGNLILGIMIASVFVESLAQTFSPMTRSFHETREAFIEEQRVLRSSNTTSNASPIATSEAVQD